MSQPKKEKSVSIRFPLDVFNAIHEIAKEDGRSFNAEVVWLLRQVIQQRKRKTKRSEEKEQDM